MYLINTKIKGKKSNLLSSLKKILGFNNNYYTLVLKTMGLNLNDNNYNKNIFVVNNKCIYILKRIFLELDEKNCEIGERVLNIMKENIKVKISKYPLYKYKFYRNFPIRGQRTRTNARTSKKLRHL